MEKWYCVTTRTRCQPLPGVVAILLEQVMADFFLVPSEEPSFLFEASPFPGERQSQRDRFLIKEEGKPTRVRNTPMLPFIVGIDQRFLFFFFLGGVGGSRRFL